MKTKIVGQELCVLHQAYSTVKFPLQTEAGGQHISSSVHPGEGNGKRGWFRRIRSRDAVAQAKDPGKSTMYPVHVRNASIDSRKSRRRRRRLLQEEETVEEKGVSSRPPEITRIFSVFQRCRTSGNDDDDDDDGDGGEYSILQEILGEGDRKGMKTFASNCEIASAKDVQRMRKIIARMFRYFSIFFPLMGNYKIKLHLFFF